MHMYQLTPQQVATMLSNIMDRHNLRADYNLDTMSVDSVCLIQTAAYHIGLALFKCLYVIDNTEISDPNVSTGWSCNEFYLEWPCKGIATVNGLSCLDKLRDSRIAHARSKGYGNTVDHVSIMGLSAVRAHPKQHAWWQEELSLQMGFQLERDTSVVSHTEQARRL